jgi:hypothetical protein
MDPVKRESEWQSSDGSRNLLCFTYRVDASAFLLMLWIGMCKNHTMGLENISNTVHRLRKGIQGTG